MDLEKRIASMTQAESLEKMIAMARAIKGFVEKELENYTPEKMSDVAEAKKGRAFLNKSSKALNDARLSAERKYMEDFNVFRAEIKGSTDKIDGASDKLGEMISEDEEREKKAKREDLELFFSGLKFSLVPLAQFFDPRWLNKSYKLEEAKKAIEDKINSILQDIKTLEALEDAEELKALYLQDLDLGSAIRAGEEMKARRKRLAEEAEAREQRDRDLQIRKQSAEELAELMTKPADSVQDMVAEALGKPVDKDPIIEYTLRFSARRSKLFELRSWMTANEITYEKVED